MERERKKHGAAVPNTSAETSGRAGGCRWRAAAGGAPKQVPTLGGAQQSRPRVEGRQRRGGGGS